MKIKSHFFTEFNGNPNIYEPVNESHEYRVFCKDAAAFSHPVHFIIIYCMDAVHMITTKWQQKSKETRWMANKQTTILENGILKCSSRCSCTMLNMMRARARWCSTIYVEFCNRALAEKKILVDYTYLCLAPSTINIRVPTSSHTIYTHTHTNTH